MPRRVDTSTLYIAIDTGGTFTDCVWIERGQVRTLKVFSTPDDPSRAIADAMHTQDETGQQILFEKGADYLLTVKGNQSTLKTNLEKLFEKKSFSPSAHSQDPGAETGAQPQSVGDPTSGLRRSDPQPGGFPWGPLGGPIGNARQTEG